VPKSRLRSQDGLLPREAAFVREFPKDFNLTKAAIRAGYSAKTAHVQGSQVLKRVRVRAALEKHLSTLTARAEISAERLIKELAKVAFSDVRDFSGWTQRRLRLMPSATLPDSAAACIQEVSAGKNGVRIKLHDKLTALAQLARYVGVVPTSPHPGDVVIYIPDNGRRLSPTAGANGNFRPGYDPAASENEG
jgi:phage terminase small subunit